MSLSQGYILFFKMKSLSLLALIMCTLVRTETLTTEYVTSGTCSICICNYSTHTVNCSFTNLTGIPPNPSPDTTVLNMSSTFIETIHDTDLDGYGELQVLDLTNTSTSNISNNAFKRLTSLTHLNISNNELLPFTNVTTNVNLFSSLQNLQELKIYGTTGTYNKEEYPDIALSQMQKLSVLWIDGLTNKTFGPAFRNMANLKTIWIPGDIIQPPWRFCDTDIRDGMLDNLIHVQNFTMRKCGLKHVGNQAFDKMANLLYLDLSNNILLTIDGISNAFASLGKTKLEVLKLNSIENVVQMTCGVTISKDYARGLARIKTLKEIHVEYNALNGFARHAIENLPKSLEYVNARKNEFEIGMYSFESHYMENLKYFDLSFNFFPDDTAIWHQDPPKLSRRSNQQPSCDRPEAVSRETGELFKETEKKTETNMLLDYFPALRFPSSKSDFTENLAHLLQIKAVGQANLGHHVVDNVCPRPHTVFPPGTITAYLPKKLEYLDISHSKFAHPIPQLDINETNSLKILNASHSLLYCWEGPITGLKTLEHLDLSLNLCQNVSSKFFHTVPNLKYLSIAINLLQSVIARDENGVLFEKLLRLEVLDMSYNRLIEIPRKFLMNQRNLLLLNLTGNLIINFNVEIGHMEQLGTIDFGMNHLSTLSKEVRDNITIISKKQYSKSKTTFNLNLRENPIQCFCNNLEFLHWAHEHMTSCRFLDVTITQCLFYNGSSVKVTDPKDFERIVKHMDKYCTSYTNIIIGVAVALCVIVNVIVGVLVHRFRWRIRYWYYVASGSQTKSRNGYISLDSLTDIGSRYKFDIYVVSTSENSTFVLGHLKHRLENEKFKAFIQDDDIIPGQNIYSVIVNAIHVSRVVIFIISEGCEQDKEWKIAFRMAQEESVKRGQPIFFGVFIDYEPGIPYSADVWAIRKRSYLDYPGNSQPANEQTFWDEMLERISEAGNNQVLSFEPHN